MPMTSAGAKTFLHALSDFWLVYFKEKALLDALSEGSALNSAQLYQQFLEAVLGTSLADCPLFERHFHRPYSLREDALVFREGASPDDDTYDVPTGDGLSDVEYLTNRVLAPTAFLSAGREFFVEPGRLRFRANPFNPAPGEALSFFPTRVVRVVSPAAWSDALADWSRVQPGDVARLTVGAAVVELASTGAVGPALHFAATDPTLQQALLRRSPRLDVLRTPYDAVISGVTLSAHPDSSDTLSSSAYDGTAINGTEVDVTGNAAYAGAWAASTAYASGALVSQGGGVKKARAAHTSASSFDATLWVDFTTGYAFYGSAEDPRVEGVYRLVAPTSPGRIRVAGGVALTTGTHVSVTRLTLAATDVRPSVAAPHTQIDPATFTLYGRRLAPRNVANPDGTTTVYPAGESLLAGVDYLLSPRDGRVVLLSAWDPLIAARAGYAWRLLVASSSMPWRGTLQTGQSYARGDVVQSGGALYAVQRAHTATGSITADYAPAREPALLSVERDVKETAVWATDAMVDTARLYRNFGALLDAPRRTSEGYRAFLQAVSRLFLLGPTFDNFESALNAVAGLPLVREDGEVQTGYTNGIVASGTDARLYDTAEGRDGALDHAAGTFAAARSAPFLPTDVGQIIRVRTATGVTPYAITAVTSASSASVDPAPALDATDVSWEFQHAALRQRVRLPGVSFPESAVGSFVRLSGARNPRNNGVFKILSIDDGLTVELDTPYGFTDESGIDWEVSDTGTQIVSTDRRDYTFPLAVPLRADVTAGAAGTLRAFESLTSAFRVVDYLEDPLWWTRVTLPTGLFDGDATQRTVTPQIIEHVYGALDGARQGDPGLRYGRDEDGTPGQERAGAATWFGNEAVTLDYDPGTPLASSRDVGRYIVVRTKKFRGQYRITAVSADGTTVSLDRFPPPEANGLNAPVRLAVDLGPILLRRTVAFVVMNSALKFHSIQVKVDPSVGLSSDLLEDALRIVHASRPSHVFVFFDAVTDFRDEVVWEDADVTLGLDHHLVEALVSADTSAAYGSPLRYGDAFRFTAGTETYAPTPGTPHALPASLPGGTAPERTLVKVAFDPATRTADARRPAEGVDYDVDYSACTVTVRGGVTLTPSSVTVRYVNCVRRILAPSDPHDPGETDVVYGGSDPTVVRATGAGSDAAGFLDRAVQITLGP